MMKKRILSFVLALAMVLSLIPATVIGSFAVGELELIVNIGTTSVVPGGTAFIDVYLEIPEMPAETDALINWQVALDYDERITVLNSNKTLYQENGSETVTLGYVNTEKKVVGVSSDVSDATEIKVIGTPGPLAAKGGVLVGTFQIAVDENIPLGEYDISVSEIAVLSFRETETANYPQMTNSFVLGEGTVGKVIVVDGVPSDGLADAAAGNGGDYVIPTLNKNGERVVSLFDEERWESRISGNFGSVYIPAQVELTTDSVDAFKAQTYILKGTQYDKSIVNGIAKKGTEDSKIALYYHKRPGCLNKVGDAVAALPSALQPKVDAMNILAVETPVLTDGNNVTVFGNIRVDDLEYDYLILEVKFTDADGKVRTFEYKTETVYTTLKSGTVPVATTSESIAGNEPTARLVDGTYLCGVTVKGVASGTYTVATTVYGATPDRNGSPIIVCSETASTVITVD